MDKLHRLRKDRRADFMRRMKIPSFAFFARKTRLKYHTARKMFRTGSKTTDAQLDRVLLVYPTFPI